MANQRDLLSPQNLVSKPKEGFVEFGPALEGMVKLMEDDATGEKASFARGLDCLIWVKIPLSAIEQVELKALVEEITNEIPWQDRSLRNWSSRTDCFCNCFASC
jgi:hypothetical protein